MTLIPNSLTFRKEERLKSKKLIQKLFSEGNSFFVFPFKVFYLPENASPTYPVQILITVPKRRFKRANKRNLIRRRIKELYRLKKPYFYTHLPQNKKYSVTLIYSSDRIPETDFLNTRMDAVIDGLISRM